MIKLKLLKQTRGWEKTPGQIKKPNNESKIDSLFGFLYTQKIVPDMM